MAETRMDQPGKFRLGQGFHNPGDTLEVERKNLLYYRQQLIRETSQVDTRIMQIDNHIRANDVSPT